MRMLSGAVVVLAGAVLTGAGSIAHQIARTAGRYSDGEIIIGAGAIVGVIGLALLASGFRSDSPLKS